MQWGEGNVMGEYVMGRRGKARRGIRSERQDLAAEISRLQVQGKKEENGLGEE